MEENSTGDPILDRLKKLQLQLDHIREKGQKTREEIRSFRHNVKNTFGPEVLLPGRDYIMSFGTNTGLASRASAYSCGSDSEKGTQ